MSFPPLVPSGILEQYVSDLWLIGTGEMCGCEKCLRLYPFFYDVM